MFKVALLAAAMAATASTTPTATSPAFDPGPAAASDVACRPGQPLDLACSLRVADADANGDGTVSPAELFALALPTTSSADGAPLHGTGLDFKDAATDGGSILPGTPDRDHSQPLLPALFALGGLVLLLRRRPT
jgi:hypothetical protein